MKDSVAIVITAISALPATLAAVFGYLGHRQNKEIIKATNGMKSELVEATKLVSHAEGEASGIAKAITIAESLKNP